MLTNSFKTHLLNNLRTLPLRNNKEEVTLSKVIDPIIELAGFKTIDIESVEEEFDSQTGDSIYPIEIDRCLKDNGDPMVFIQCKQLGSKHLLKNDHNKTFKAARLKHIPWVVFTDGEIWEFYKLGDLDYENNKIITLRYDQSRYQEIVNMLQNVKKEIYGYR